MKKLKKMFRNLFLTGLTVAFLFAVLGCKQPDNGSAGTSEITVTVEKDSHVKEAPKNFKLAKNSVLGFTELKQKIPGLKFKTGYELGKICLEKANGKEITDVSKYKFDKDTVIFIVSKTVGGSDEVKLTELKVDGVFQAISEIINLGETEENKFELAWKTEPADAEVKFEPELEKGKFWVLGNTGGKKELKITVSKNLLKKEYSLTSDKMPNVKISEFIVQGSKQEISGKKINCGKTKNNNVSIEYLTYPSDAQIKFEPPLEPGDTWNLGAETGLKKLKITVTKGAEKREYTASIEKITADYLSLSKVSVDDNYKQGDDIISNMDFGISDKGFVTVKVEPSAPDALISFQGASPSNEKEYKWYLAGEIDNILNVKLMKGNEETSYNLHIKTHIPPVEVSYILNNTGMPNLPNEFDKKARNGSNPLLEVEADRLNIQFFVRGKFNEFYINQEKIGDSTTNSRGYFEHSIKLLAEEKSIEIKITQKESEYKNLSNRILKFRAKGNGKREKISAILRINDNAQFSPEFLKNLKNASAPPLYKIHNSSAKIYIGVSIYDTIFNVKNIEINGENLNFNSTPDFLTVEFAEKEISPIEDAKPTLVTVKFIPKDSQIEPLVWYFNLQGGGGKPEVYGMKLLKLNDIAAKDLPKSFTDYIKDGSNPLYEFDGKTAIIEVLANDPRLGINLVDSVDFKMDGELLASVSAGEYKAFHTYNIEDENPHNIEIIFNPIDTDSFSSCSFKFQLKHSGKKALLPENLLDLYINGKTGNGLPKDVMEHLTDGTNPVYKIEGNKLHLYVITEDKTLFERLDNLTITIGDNAPVIIQFMKYPYSEPGEPPQWFAGQDNFNLPNIAKPVLVTMKVTPKDIESYETLTYSFKAEGSNTISMPLAFGVNDKAVKPGQTIKTDGELATLLVQADANLIKSVKIGEEGKEEDCIITAFQDLNGNPHWRAEKIVQLADKEKTFIISAEPKNSTKYHTTVCKIQISGRKVLKSNAEFVFAGEQPKINSKTKFKAGCSNQFINNYGLLEGTFTFYTVSPRASVKYAFVDINGNILPGEQEHETASNTKEGSHITEQITVLPDKPTQIKFWVISENGKLNPKKGEYILYLNPVDLGWDYTKPKKEYEDMDISDFKNRAYGTIKIKKENIPSDNIIYLVFKGWGIGYKVNKDNKPDEQGEIKDGKELTIEQKKCYITTLDVSKLKDKTAAYLEARINFTGYVFFGTGPDAFTYKVRVEIEE